MLKIHGCDNLQDAINLAISFESTLNHINVKHDPISVVLCMIQKDFTEIGIQKMDAIQSVSGNADLALAVTKEELLAAWDKYIGDAEPSFNTAFIFAAGFLGAKNIDYGDDLSKKVLPLLFAQMSAGANMLSKECDSSAAASKIVRPGAASQTLTQPSDVEKNPNFGMKVFDALMTARDTAIAIHDPHTSLAQVVRWGNQLVDDLNELGANLDLPRPAPTGD